MRAPRTCSATFSPTAVVSAPPVQVPPGTAPRGDRGRRGSSQQSTEQTDSRPSPGSHTTPSSSPSSSHTGPTAPDTSAPTVDPSVVTQPPTPPPTDEAYAKGKIQELLKAYCAAFEAIDPDAVQRVYPKVDMARLRIELNTSKYKSVQCKFSEPVFVSLDPLAGTAKIRTEIKRVYEHTIPAGKSEPSELIFDMALLRSAPRSPWLIDSTTFKQKPK
jgi:hypothetical protein